MGYSRETLAYRARCRDNAREADKVSDSGTNSENVSDSASEWSPPPALRAAFRTSPGGNSPTDLASNRKPNQAGRSHTRPTPSPSPQVNKKRRVSPSNSASASSPSLAPVAATRWSQEEKDQLKEMLAEGHTQAQIGAALGRSKHAVSGQITKLRETGFSPKAPNAASGSGAAKSKSGPPHVSAASESLLTSSLTARLVS